MEVSNELLSFKGRMERKAFCPRFIVLGLINFFSIIGTKLIGVGVIGLFGKLLFLLSRGNLFALAFLVSYAVLISLMIRRFRDIEVSPLWVLPSCVILLVFWVVGIILCFRKGKYDYNKITK